MPNSLSAPTFMLRTVTSGGALDKFLSDFTELSLSPVFCEAGTVTFKYPQNGINWDLLGDDKEIAITIDGTEIGGLRCIIEAIEGNDADEAEDGAIWSYTARTTFGLFDRGRVYPKNWPVTNPPTYEFVNASPGKIMIDLIQACQARGALTSLTWDFTTTHDSAGQSWLATRDVAWDAGMSLTEVIAELVGNGAFEVQMNKRIFQAYNPDTLGTDRSVGTAPLRFLKGRDLKESPRRSTTRDLVTSVLVAGDDNVYVERVSSGSITSQWGRREGYLSQGGIRVPGILDRIGDWYLGTLNRPVQEITHSLSFDTEDNPRPITNFNLGDWGLSDVGRGWEKYRIKQWVINVENSGEINGSVVLNDLINERIDRLNKKLQSLQNGTSGSGASEQKDDGKAPAAPTSISPGTDPYIVNGQSRATLSIQWAPVTTNADGTALSDLDGYRARWKYSTDSTWRGTQTVDSDETIAFFDNLNTGKTVNTQVMAFDRYNHNSAWASGPNITTAVDTTSPEKPSPPVVTSTVGTLRVQWDGLDYLGQQMSADFDGVEVHVGPNGTFTPNSSTLKDYLRVRSVTATTLTRNLVYGTEYWVRLVAVDSSGNKSAPTDETSTSHAVLTQVVQTEIGTGQVGLGNTRFSDVGNLIDDGNFELADVRTQRQTQITGTHLAFDNTTSSNGTWSLRSDAWAGTNAENLILQTGLPVKSGERIFGAIDMRATSNSNGQANLGIRWKDKNNNYIDASGNPDPSVYYILAGIGTVVKNNTWQSRLNFMSSVAPVNVSTMELGFYTNLRTAGTVWVDALEVRRQVDTLLVSDAAITTAKIADLAVNNAKINDLNVGKLTTGTLVADIFVGARIKTSNTGARAEMNSGGFGLWNSSNVQTLYASSTNGEIRIKGQLVSEFSGRRVEVNPTSTNLPEIRFYPTNGSNYGFLNAVDGDNNAEVWVGLNSGQFSGNSTSSAYRLYMLDNTFGAHFETIRMDTQDSDGGFWSINNLGANGGVSSGGRVHGFVDFYHDSSSSTIGAQIGHNGNTIANDSWAVFEQNGTIHFIGKMLNTVAPFSNQALVCGTWSLSSSVSTATWSWGTTSDSIWYPNVQVRDQTAHAVGIELTAANWTANYDTATAGVSGLNWWAWRS